MHSWYCYLCPHNVISSSVLKRQCVQRTFQEAWMYWSYNLHMFGYEIVITNIRKTTQENFKAPFFRGVWKLYIFPPSRMKSFLVFVRWVKGYLYTAYTNFVYCLHSARIHLSKPIQVRFCFLAKLFECRMYLSITRILFAFSFVHDWPDYESC